MIWGGAGSAPPFFVIIKQNTTAERGSAMKQQKAPKTGQGGPRRHSLKWSMIGMVLFCWILPVLLIVAGADVYIFNSLAT